MKLRIVSARRTRMILGEIDPQWRYLIFQSSALGGIGIFEILDHFFRVFQKSGTFVLLILRLSGRGVIPRTRLWTELRGFGDGRHKYLRLLTNFLTFHSSIEETDSGRWPTGTRPVLTPLQKLAILGSDDGDIANPSAAGLRSSTTTV